MPANAALRARDNYCADNVKLSFIFMAISYAIVCRLAGVFSYPFPCQATKIAYNGDTASVGG